MTTTPEVRALARRIAGAEATAHQRGEQLAHSALEDGAIREFDLEGTQTAQYGKQFDGTSVAATLVSPPPPAPSTPVAVGVPGGFKVYWNGTFGNDITVVAPMDWRQVDVVAGPVGMDPIATPPSVGITSPRGGEVFVPAVAGNYEVALVSRTLAGRPSEPSVSVAVTALALVDDAQFQEALDDLTAAQGRLDTAETDIAASEAEIVAAKARLTVAEQDAIDALADALAASNAAVAAQADADAATTLAGLAQAKANSAITVYRQATAPASGMETNDLWIDSDDGLLYVWTGAWTLSADQRIAAVVTSNATKTTVFAQTSSPSTTGRTTGDMWIDTDDFDKVYRWTGAAWTATTLATAGYIASRATDQVTNGTGLLLSNQNFSGMFFDQSDTPPGCAGSFTVALGNTVTRGTDEYMAVDPSKPWALAAWARQKVAGNTALTYTGLQPFDAAKLAIDPGHYMYVAGTKTTLAVDLIAGATTITLTSQPTAWYGSAGKNAGASVHLRRIIFWDYVDSFGKAWPEDTYSRNVSATNYWADGAIAGNVITLNAPYAGPTKPAGTKVSNGSSSGTYMYAGWVGVAPTEVWTRRSEVIKAATVTGGGGATAATGWPPGVAFARVIVLPNYQNALSNHIYGGFSLSDASAAQISADAANALATIAKSTADAKITVFRQASAPAVGPAGTYKINGDLWIDSDDGMVYYTSTTTGTWVASPDQRIGTVVTSNATKTTVFAQTSQPSTSGRTIGDIWLDTDDGNKIYDWSGSWTARTLGAAAISATARQLGAITIYRQSTAPASGMVTNDMWIDSDDGLLYIYTGAWTLSADQRIAAVVASDAIKTTLFSQPSAPSTSGRTTGDMWIDTDDGNKIYDWAAGAWTARLLGNSALSDLDVNKLVVVGTANLNVAVANEIAAKTAAFQTADIANLFVTEGANINVLVAQRIAAEVGEFLTIRANNLESVMAMVTTLTSGGTGRRWEAGPDGIRVYEADGSILINFPTDPDTPSSFYGDLVATSLTIADQLAIRGLVNEISKGAQLVLASGTTAPSGPPSVTIDWESIDTSFGNGDPGYAGFDPPRYGWVRWNGKWRTAASVWGGNCSIQEYDDSGDYLGVFQNPTITCTNVQSGHGGLTVLGANIYVLGQEPSFFGDGDWYVEGFDATGAQIALWQWVPPANATDAVIWNNGASILIAWVDTVLNKLMWRSYNAATGAAGGAATTTTLTLGAGTVPSAAWYGAADFGANRLIVTFINGGIAYAVDGGGTYQPNDNFPLPTSGIKGLDYYTGIFWTHDPAGHKLHKHTTHKWTSESAMWHLSNTWYDSNATGSTHETAQGPRKSFTMKKRARLNVTVGLIPVRPIPNTTDDAVAARLYLGRGAVDPGRANMERAATLADGNRNGVILAHTFPAGAAVDPPPAASDFPASSPGRIISADGTSLVLNGDGSGVVGGPTGIAFTSTGVQASGLRAQKKKDAVGKSSTSSAYTPTSVAVADSGMSFVAPPSGTITVILSALCRSTVAAQYCKVDYEIRAGSTIGAGTVARAGDTAVSTSLIATLNVEFQRHAGTDVHTGLTPGAIYNIYPVMAAHSGQNVSVAGTSLVIIPSL